MMEYADRKLARYAAGRYPEIPRIAQAALSSKPKATISMPGKPGSLRPSALIDASWFAVSAKGPRALSRLSSLPARTRHRDDASAAASSKWAQTTPSPSPATVRCSPSTASALNSNLPGSYVIYGHIGDAHLHVNMLPATQAKPTSPPASARVRRARRALGGTVSAEHGLGKRKAKLLELQYSQEEIDVMRRIKQRLDPQWLLGRGTLFAQLPSTT